MTLPIENVPKNTIRIAKARIKSNASILPPIAIASATISEILLLIGL